MRCSSRCGAFALARYVLSRRSSRTADRKFLPFGCSASAECIHTIGPRGRICWWVEGYATGLAVREALDAIYRHR